MDPHVYGYPQSSRTGRGGVEWRRVEEMFDPTARKVEWLVLFPFRREREKIVKDENERIS
jgi:hypothetical protein